MQALMLYIHIPFCEQKCKYCDFLSAASSQQERQDYVDTLCKEIELHKECGKEARVTSLFFGGGTPSILSGEQITQIMKAIRSIFIYMEETAEITLETNPGTVNREKLQTYMELGINRLSMGLQATNNKELKELGRIHSYEVFLDTYNMAREVGFTNINVDLMSAIPGQTLESWKDTLDKIVALQPEHISAYSLIIEEGTPFFEEYSEKGEKYQLLPSEEEERSMYYETQIQLHEAGYKRYEISNYAKKNKECVHNLGYWERKSYLGLGLGASSLMNETRHMNYRNYKDYKDIINSKAPPIEQSENITKVTQQEEYIFLGLRKIKGISLEQYKECFGDGIEKNYKNSLEELFHDNLITKKGEFLHLTEKGIDLSNYVLSKFLID